MIQDTHFIADPLHNPDRKSIGPRAGAADVDQGAQPQQRIGGDFSNSALRPRFGHHFREIRTLERARVDAFPYVLIPLRVFREIELSFPRLKKPAGRFRAAG